MVFLNTSDLDTSVLVKRCVFKAENSSVGHHLLDLVQWSKENVSMDYTGTSMYAPVETATAVMT